MKTFQTYLGSGSTMYLGIGGIPKELEIYNLATGLSLCKWNIGMLANSAVAGGLLFTYAPSTTTMTAQTATQGLVPYAGGDIVTAALQGANYVVDPGAGLDLGYTSLQGSATLFTLDTAASGTGHFNGALATGAGAGSKITLTWRDQNGMPQVYEGRISALSASGLSANQVTLAPIPPSMASILSTGIPITFVSAQYDLVQAPTGLVMPSGVKLINTTCLTSAVQYAIAWQ